ncbi:TRAM domain-containing protein [Gordonia sp. NB41Y]|uniref:class I SAM-dependent RNA methyltransferase n=1 Tax=Gordonia sp. NB41Y TaxID=875808 RepID=UPI00273B4168|nr:TRAM domain-containing protein [Gordonia sp. NB41Y]WLP91066.1 TRAM domain-containing protein [Gordonia sp. NB41Y]
MTDTDILLTLRVDRPANGGTAVGRADDGRAVFVRGAIPGEQVTARIVEEKPRFLTAETVDVLEPAPQRIDELCAAAAHGAGCCDQSFITPDHVRGLKAEVLRDVLGRIGGFDAARLDRLLPGEAVRALDGGATGWRIRTRLAVDADGRPGLHERGGAGIVTGDPCAQNDPLMVADLGDGYAPGGDLAITLDDTGTRHIVEIGPVPAAAAGGGRPPRGGPERGGSSRGRSRDRRAAQQRRRHREAPRPQRVVAGAPTAGHRVGARRWEIPVAGFWQGHRAAPDTYAATVTDMVRSALGDAAPGVCWDLYGGAGVFAAALTDTLAAGSVHVVESDPGALEAAEHTFTTDTGIHLHPGEVARLIADLPAPQVVVLDPPRTGAGPAVIAQLADAAPEVIVHVGCDVGRFARDLGLYGRHGYTAQRITGFDAFPLTHHLEAIAVLVRSTSRH